jgi:hypothetical protein
MIKEIIGRRSFLVSVGRAGIGVSALYISGGLISTSEAANENVQTFRALSGLVTGKSDLDINLAERAYSQLSALDSDFPRKVATLVELARSSGAKTIDALLASPKQGDETSRAAIFTIASAWYFGFTGTPISLRAEDGTGFVTFTKALMYEPTIDATVRPSYARGGTDYWIDPPSFVTVPQMPAGIRSWGRESPQGVGKIPGLDSLSSVAKPATAAPVKSDP